MISLVPSIDLRAVLILPTHGPWILLVVFLEDGVSIRNEIKSPKSSLAKGPGPYGGCRTTRCCCSWINSALIPIVCRLSVVELCHHLFEISMKGWNTLSGFPLFPKTSHKYLHNGNVSRLCAYTAGKRWMDIFAYICKSLKCRGKTAYPRGNSFCVFYHFSRHMHLCIYRSSRFQAATWFQGLVALSLTLGFLNPGGIRQRLFCKCRDGGCLFATGLHSEIGWSH